MLQWMASHVSNWLTCLTYCFTVWGCTMLFCLCNFSALIAYWLKPIQPTAQMSDEENVHAKTWNVVARLSSRPLCDPWTRRRPDRSCHLLSWKMSNGSCRRYRKTRSSLIVCVCFVDFYVVGYKHIFHGPPVTACFICQCLYWQTAQRLMLLLCVFSLPVILSLYLQCRWYEYMQ